MDRSGNMTKTSFTIDSILSASTKHEYSEHSSDVSNTEKRAEATPPAADSKKSPADHRKQNLADHTCHGNTTTLEPHLENLVQQKQKSQEIRDDEAPNFRHMYETKLSSKFENNYQQSFSAQMKQHCAKLIHDQEGRALLQRVQLYQTGPFRSPFPSQMLPMIPPDFLGMYI